MTADDPACLSHAGIGGCLLAEFPNAYVSAVHAGALLELRDADWRDLMNPAFLAGDLNTLTTLGHMTRRLGARAAWPLQRVAAIKGLAVTAGWESARRFSFRADMLLLPEDELADIAMGLVSIGEAEDADFPAVLHADRYWPVIVVQAPAGTGTITRGLLGNEDRRDITLRLTEPQAEPTVEIASTQSTWVSPQIGYPRGWLTDPLVSFETSPNMVYVVIPKHPILVRGGMAADIWISSEGGMRGVHSTSAPYDPGDQGGMLDLTAILQDITPAPMDRDTPVSGQRPVARPDPAPSPDVSATDTPAAGVRPFALADLIGRYTAVGQCDAQYIDTEIHIAHDTISFHESFCQVQSVEIDPNAPDVGTLHLSCEVEGETRSQTATLQLRPDGRLSMTQQWETRPASSSDTVVLRDRCDGAAQGNDVEVDVLYVQDFETVASGALPTGVEIVFDGAGRSNQRVINTTDSRVLRTEARRNWSLAMRQDLPDLRLPDRVRLEVRMLQHAVDNAFANGTRSDPVLGTISRGLGGFSIKPEGGTGTLSFGVGLVSRQEDGALYAVAGQGEERIARRIAFNSWIDIAADIDFAAGTAELFIEGELVGTTRLTPVDLGTRWNSWGTDTAIRYSSGNATETRTFFDNIRISGLATSAAAVAPVPVDRVADRPGLDQDDIVMSCILDEDGTDIRVIVGRERPVGQLNMWAPGELQYSLGSLHSYWVTEVSEGDQFLDRPFLEFARDSVTYRVHRNDRDSYDVTLGLGPSVGLTRSCVPGTITGSLDDVLPNGRGVAQPAETAPDSAEAARPAPDAAFFTCTIGGTIELAVSYQPGSRVPEMTLRYPPNLGSTDPRVEVIPFDSISPGDSFIDRPHAAFARSGEWYGLYRNEAGGHDVAFELGASTAGVETCQPGSVRGDLNAFLGAEDNRTEATPASSRNSPETVIFACPLRDGGRISLAWDGQEFVLRDRARNGEETTLRSPVDDVEVNRPARGMYLTLPHPDGGVLGVSVLGGAINWTPFEGRVRETPGVGSSLTDCDGQTEYSDFFEWGRMIEGVQDGTRATLPAPEVAATGPAPVRLADFAGSYAPAGQCNNPYSEEIVTIADSLIGFVESSCEVIATRAADGVPGAVIADTLCTPGVDIFDEPRRPSSFVLRQRGQGLDFGWVDSATPAHRAFENTTPYVRCAETAAAPPQPRAATGSHVLTTGANLRSGPSTQFDIVDVGAEGDVVTVLERAVNDSGTEWARIRFDGFRTAFVSARLLRPLSDSRQASGTCSATTRDGDTIPLQVCTITTQSSYSAEAGEGGVQIDLAFRFGANFSLSSVVDTNLVEGEIAEVSGGCWRSVESPLRVCFVERGN